jgi:hypothetical protein
MALAALCAPTYAGTFSGWDTQHYNDNATVNVKADGTASIQIGAIVGSYGSKGYVGTSQYKGIALADIKSIDFAWDVANLDGKNQPVNADDPTLIYTSTHGPSPYIDMQIDVSGDGVADGSLSWSIGKTGYHNGDGGDLAPFSWLAGDRQYGDVTLTESKGGWWWCEPVLYTDYRTLSSGTAYRLTLDGWTDLLKNARIASQSGVWAITDTAKNSDGVRLSYGSKGGDYPYLPTCNLTGFSINAVPEPSSLLAGITGLCSLIGVRGFRKRK